MHVQRCTSTPAAEAPSLGGVQASGAAVLTARCRGAHVPPCQQQVPGLCGTSSSLGQQHTGVGGWVICGAAGYGGPRCNRASCRHKKKCSSSSSSSSSAGQAGGSMQQTQPQDTSAGQQDEVDTTATVNQQLLPVRDTTSTRLRPRKPAPVQQDCADESADSDDLGEVAPPTQLQQQGVAATPKAAASLQPAAEGQLQHSSIPQVCWISCFRCRAAQQQLERPRASQLFSNS